MPYSSFPKASLIVSVGTIAEAEVAIVYPVAKISAPSNTTSPVCPFTESTG